ncbi:hypothetical protein D9757_004945 [Collybiopsis confluens]|uniref:Uncharacterized protein n=1 Tax=Collybiopsis confluens TaxID=2823264 RepID=A0A8H5HT80_9AGAR|nr:hypothetical protein D9757_004945 [Collybiopsis confluens]
MYSSRNGSVPSPNTTRTVYLGRFDDPYPRGLVLAQGRRTPVKSSSLSSSSSISSSSSATSDMNASSPMYLVPPPVRCPTCGVGIVRAVATVEKWLYPGQCELCDLAYEKSGLRHKLQSFENIQSRAGHYRQKLIAASNTRLPPPPNSCANYPEEQSRC